MAEEPYHLGIVKSLRIEGGNLLIRFEKPGGILAMGCPDWLKELDEDRRQQWRQIEGGLYWPALEQALRIPQPLVDPEKLEKAIRKLTGEEDSE